MTCVIGVDIGSVATKIAFLIDGQIVDTSCVLTGARAGKLVDEQIDYFLEQHKITNFLIMAGGYGRNLISRQHETVSEVKANIKGIIHLLKEDQLPQLVINIGGQDIKIIFLNDKGQMDHLIFNDKCAAGTGRFFETLCRMLELDFNTLSDKGMTSNKIIPVSSTCVVFAENEIINLLAKSYSVDDIVASYNHSVAKRIFDLTSNYTIPDHILIDGGVGLNKGFVFALEKIFNKKISILPQTQLTTAIGAAAIGWHNYFKKSKKDLLQQKRP